MQPRTLRLSDPVDALVVEQALAFPFPPPPPAKRLRTARASTWPNELAAVTRGRELTRRALEAALRAAVAPAEQRGAQRPCSCQTRRQSKGQTPRDAPTAAGRVPLRRRSLVCPACGAGCHPRGSQSAKRSAVVGAA